MLTENKEEKGFGKFEIDLRISKECSEIELYKGTLRKKFYILVLYIHILLDNDNDLSFRRASRDNLNLVNNNNNSSSNSSNNAGVRVRRDGSGGGDGRRASSAPRRGSRGGGAEDMAAAGRSKEEKEVKRRSYHPQDGLFQVVLVYDRLF